MSSPQTTPPPGELRSTAQLAAAAGAATLVAAFIAVGGFLLALVFLANRLYLFAVVSLVAAGGLFVAVQRVAYHYADRASDSREAARRAAEQKMPWDEQELTAIVRAAFAKPEPDGEPQLVLDDDARMLRAAVLRHPSYPRPASGRHAGSYDQTAPTSAFRVIQGDVS